LFVRKYSKNIPELNNFISENFEKSDVGEWLNIIIQAYIKAGDFGAAKTLIHEQPEGYRKWTELLDLAKSAPDDHARQILTELYDLSRSAHLVEGHINEDRQQHMPAWFIARVGAAQVARGFDQDGLQSLRLSYELAKQSDVSVQASALTEIATTIQQLH
ncbi:MAG: hypothetical protein AAF556_12755, partial [Pseudomonadota bacterium]